jgi:hypothetical protein
MPFNKSGITTGLLGYTLKKELLGDALYYRETEVFNYEIYSANVSGISGSNFLPSVIHRNIYNEFTGKYSGDINVKVFQVPGDYYFPADSLRAAKFNVQVEVRRLPSGVTGQSELTSGYYRGLDSSFFANYATVLNDFKEDFGFEMAENGSQIFNHNISFALLTGDRNLASTIAGTLFANDKDTTFGVSAMIGGVTIGDTGQFLNYFTESYDTIRNVFSFNKKREILPLSGATYVYNLVHTLEFKDDGFCDVTERGNVKGARTFPQAQAGAETLIAAAYTRANTFYSNYRNFAAGTSITDALVTAPTRTIRNFNRPSIEADYEINFTNNPNFGANSVLTDETIELDADEKNLVDIKHSFNFTINKRNPPAGGISSLIDTAYANSYTRVNSYYTASNFFNAGLPIDRIRYVMNWPSNRSKGGIDLDYSNNPKYFVTINGIMFYSLETKVQDTRPADMLTEYKVVNRPNQTSILNYAYQTDKGQLQVSIVANLGRNPNEFVGGFRSNIGTTFQTLYRYGVQIFMNQFQNVIPASFTYQLSDIKYSVNSDGVLQLNLSFTYTLKKYTL